MRRTTYFFGILFLLLTASFQSGRTKSSYFSPIDLALDTQNRQLFVAGKTAREIRAYSFPDFSLSATYTTNLPPKALKVSGPYLLVVCSFSQGEVVLLDKLTLKFKSSIAAGHGACDIELSPDSYLAYVANQYSNDISVLDLHLKKEVGRIPVLRQPKQLAVSGDGRLLFVANYLPAGPADVDTVSSEITVIDLQTEKVLKHIPLANGSNALRGMCLSGDGNYLLVTHNLGRFQVPTTQLEQGWMNTSALSILDVGTQELFATVLLDESDRGAAGSWGVDCTGDHVFVAHSGTHDFSRIDYSALLQKLGQYPERNALAYDLTFLSGIRERISINGNGPRALMSFQNKLILANYFSDNFSIIDFDRPEGSQNELALMPPAQADQVRLGEMYFHDASFCFQSWQSCTGCHPDNGRTDGLNWDLLNDGLGNPKNCKSLVLSHETPPSMITGIRTTAESAVRSGFEYIQFMKVDEKVSTAVDAYLRSLKPVPSPHLVNDALNPVAEKGKIIFERENCHSCHPAPLFTDQKMHTMGRTGEYDRQNTWDTPTLAESWRTGPYLHDGRCATMMEVFSKEKHGLENELIQTELEQLVEYVLSL